MNNLFLISLLVVFRDVAVWGVQSMGQHLGSPCHLGKCCKRQIENDVGGVGGGGGGQIE